MEKIKESERENALTEEVSDRGSFFLKTDTFRRMSEQKHHCTDLADHSFKTAREALRIADLLKKLNIDADRDLLVSCALCHDIGMIGRHEKYGSEFECCKKHPSDSVDLYSDLVHKPSFVEEDCIRHHMWPASGKHPRTKEGIIINLADKSSYIREYLSLLKRKS